MQTLNKNRFSMIISTLLVLVIALMAFMSYSFSFKHNTDLYNSAQSKKVERKLQAYISVATDTMVKKPMQYMEETISGYIGKSTPIHYDNKEVNLSNKDKVDFYTIIFVASIVLLLLTYFISPKDIFIFSILTVSIIAWIVGVFTPIMTVEVGKDLPLLGQTVFLFESKGIWSSIEKLWILEDYIVSILIVVFSLLIPIIKTISLYISVLLKRNIKFIELIGKWSMADVFVMSILLASMSLNTDEMTDAKIHVAIYFFFIYVVLSMLASVVVKKSYLESKSS